MNKTTMKFFCIGINHKTASVELRERLNVSYDQLKTALNQTPTLESGAIVSTCNRIELYLTATHAIDRPSLIKFWSDCCDVRTAIFADAVYTYTDDAAVKHLLRVAAGLESMVLGEPQILGQVTRAYEASIANQIADAHLKSIFQFAIRAGKRARTETDISRNPVSVSSIGVSLIQRHAHNKASANILVIGAGEMAQLAVKGLKKFGFGSITLVNRSLPKAEELAKKWEIKAAPLHELPHLLQTADGAVTATAAPDPIIGVDQLNNRDKKITLVDLAVPRDIDPACGQLNHVRLYDVDALRYEVAEGLAERQKEVPKVEKILNEAYMRYRVWLKEATVQPTLTALRLQAEQIRRKELARTLKYLGDADPETLKHVEKLSQSLVKQLLHRPTMLLRDEARNGTLNGLEESTKKLFDL